LANDALIFDRDFSVLDGSDRDRVASAIDMRNLLKFI
jgi:hypothetical protein